MRSPDWGELNQNNSIDVPPNPPDKAPNRFPDGPAVGLPGCSNLQRSERTLVTWFLYTRGFHTSELAATLLKKAAYHHLRGFGVCSTAPPSKQGLYLDFSQMDMCASIYDQVIWEKSKNRVGCREERNTELLGLGLFTELVRILSERLQSDPSTLV